MASYSRQMCKRSTESSTARYSHRSRCVCPMLSSSSILRAGVPELEEEGGGRGVEGWMGPSSTARRGCRNAFRLGIRLAGSKNRSG